MVMLHKLIATLNLCATMFVLLDFAMSTSTPQLGLRERKKQQTRQLIAETARRLFGERGFERVTVAEIARAAEVSEQTVFNYFPTKEDLVYWRLESFEDELLRGDPRARSPASRRSPPSAASCSPQRGLLAEHDPEARERARRAHADDQPRARRCSRASSRSSPATPPSLAALLAEETGADAADVRPWVAANAMMGVHRAIVHHARRRVIEGARHTEAGDRDPRPRRGGAGPARRGPRGLRGQGLTRSAAISSPDAARVLTARAWFHAVQSAR